MHFLKAILITCIFTSATLSVVAQPDVHIGVIAGYQATFISDQGIAQAPRYKGTMSYNWSPVGVSAGVDFGRKLGLSLETIFTTQGQQFDIIDIADQIVGSRKIEMRYLQIPLLIRFTNESNASVRGNFSIGAQASFLRDASDVLFYSASTQMFPAGAALPSGAVARPRPDGNVQAIVPAQPLTTLMSHEKGDFRKIGYHAVVAFGLDIDLARHLYLSVQLRGNYNLAEMRAATALEKVKASQTTDAYGRRADWMIGAQTGVHYMFSSTRSFRYKGSKPTMRRH